jgi:hypothetical protein
VLTPSRLFRELQIGLGDASQVFFRSVLDTYEFVARGGVGRKQFVEL